MNLGERIYELRNEKNLSQGDLADALDVSRQSVSKWENNTAVPDLDKLIKLCDVFEISLDELTGRKKTEKMVVYTVPQIVEKTPPKIAGYVFLGITLFSAIFLLVTAPLAIYLCIPLLLCTIICFKVKTNVWYWCIWAMYIPLEFFILLGFRIDIRIITKFLFIVVMAIITWFAFKDIEDNVTKMKRVSSLVLSIVGVLACEVLIWFLFYSNMVRIDGNFDMWIFASISAIMTALLGVGMFQVVRLIHNRK